MVEEKRFIPMSVLIRKMVSDTNRRLADVSTVLYRYSVLLTQRINFF